MVTTSTPDLLSNGTSSPFYNFDSTQINNHVALLNSSSMSNRVTSMLPDSIVRSYTLGQYSVNASA